MQVLVIAPQSRPCQRLVALLERRGHQVESLEELPLVVSSLRAGRYGLLVLTVDAIARDAANLCAHVVAARSGPTPPLIVWTEQADPTCLELLLRAGADDCLVATLDDVSLSNRLMVNEHWAQTVGHITRPQACHGSAPFACCPLLQEMPYGVFRTTPEGRFVEINQTLVRMLGYTTKAELLALDLNCDLYSDPNVRHEILSLDRDYVDGIEVAWKRKDGTAVMLHLAGRILRDEQGQIVWLEGIAEDLTPRKEAEAAFRDQVERNRLILENSQEGFAICDLAGRLLEVNPHFCDLAGYARQELLAMDLAQLDVQRTALEVTQAIQESAQCGATQYSTRMRQKSGNILDIEVRVRRSCFGPQEVLLLFIRDLTHRRQAEEAIQQEQDRLRQLLELHERDRQVLATELHDELAQQLTGALMTLEAAWQLRITTASQASEQYQRGLNLLRQGIAYSRQLVSGLRPPSLDEFGLIPAIEHLISQHQFSGRPEIQFTSKGHCQRLAQPLESAIFRIVQETLANAVRHSRSARIYVELASSDSQLWITVQDWGIGFETTRLSKSSAGLEGVRERARLFGGQAIIQTAPGRGTLIHVQLPLIPPRETLRATTSVPAPLSADGLPPKVSRRT